MVGNQVIVTGKVAGLGNGDITYEIDVDAELTIFLVNPGAKGNKPPGQNKERILQIVRTVFSCLGVDQ